MERREGGRKEKRKEGQKRRKHLFNFLCMVLFLWKVLFPSVGQLADISSGKVHILEELGSIQQNHNKEKQHSMLGSPIALSPNPATDFEEFFYLNLLFCKH